jgi:hypothetical protein
MAEGTGQPYGRVFNFSAGPACLPLDVLEQAQAEMLNWNGSGEQARPVYRTWCAAMSRQP